MWTYGHSPHEASSSITARPKVIEGFRVPDDGPFTANERGWVELLRTLVGDLDPPLTLRVVQLIREALTSR